MSKTLERLMLVACCVAAVVLLWMSSSRPARESAGQIPNAERSDGREPPSDATETRRSGAGVAVDRPGQLQDPVADEAALGPLLSECTDEVRRRVRASHEYERYRACQATDCAEVLSQLLFDVLREDPGAPSQGGCHWSKAAEFEHAQARFAALAARVAESEDPLERVAALQLLRRLPVRAELPLLAYRQLAERPVFELHVLLARHVRQPPSPALAEHFVDAVLDEATDGRVREVLWSALGHPETAPQLRRALHESPPWDRTSRLYAGLAISTCGEACSSLLDELRATDDPSLQQVATVVTQAAPWAQGAEPEPLTVHR